MGIQNVLGVNYPYPDVNDKPWGDEHIDWATAVSEATNTLETQIGSATTDITVIEGQIVSILADLADKVETSSNSGAGEGLALAKVGFDLPFKSIVAGTNITLTPDATTLTISASATSSGDVPVGTILPWWDFGVLAYPAGYWPCNGTVIVDGASPLNGFTSPDLSGAALTGLGTLGGGDNNTVPFSSVVVGNANNQINIAHTHTHSHTHTGGSHTHGAGSYKFKTAEGSASHLKMYDTSGNADNVAGVVLNVGLIGGTTCAIPEWATQDYFTDTNSGTGSSASGGTVSTGGASTATTSSGLSSTQNIQPRSQPVRYIMRVS